ncbi:MAG TPA: alkaline phosphatase family protein [Nitrososphaeraceae archaeon]|nr:alkaline phosphatase family protein [Nitrososphaeraceae archaeon]
MMSRHGMNTAINHSIQNLFYMSIICVSISILISCLVIEFSINETLALTSNSDEKSNTPIKHVIVISQGRRSFDNYFGTFPGANGLPQNLTVPFNPFPPPLQKFTVETWFNTNNTFLNNAFLVNKGGVGSDTSGYNMNYGIWMNSNGNIVGGFETIDGVDFTVRSDKKYNDGSWHQAVVTYDGKENLKLYVDGNQIGINKTNGVTPDLTGTKPIRVGSNSFKPEYYYSGFIDEIRIWNRTLEQAEILKGYFNNSYDQKMQIVYSSFEENENSQKNTTNSPGEPSLNGIYLNGSTYQDIKFDVSKYTSYLGPYHLTKTKTDAPNYGENAYDLSYNNGQMNGFVISQYLDGKDPSLVLGYYNSSNLRFYWKFATEYVIADNFFASTLDTGFQNENYLYTGLPVVKEDDISYRHLSNLNRTIFDELQKNNISWKIYVDDHNPALNQTEGSLKKNRFLSLLTETPRFHDNKTLNANIVDLVEYFQDLANDDFPAVAYIVAPNFEDNAPRDVTVGEEFVASLILALMKSKHWDDSAFIVTYRESGGWYDHVPPPKVDGQTYGFRVPAFIISPYSKVGFVDSTLYDASSILKFIEYNYNISSIGKRDAAANNLLNAFDFTKEPRDPLILNSGIVKNLNQEMNKNIIKSKYVFVVNLIYLAVLPSIAIIGFVIFWLGYRRPDKSNLISDKSQN